MEVPLISTSYRRPCYEIYIEKKDSFPPLSQWNVLEWLATLHDWKVHLQQELLASACSGFVRERRHVSNASQVRFVERRAHRAV